MNTNTVYIVEIITRQQDTRIGNVFTSRDAAESECDRQCSLENVNSAWVVIRKIVRDDG